MTRDVVLTFAVRAARLALGVIASVVTARALGPTGRGDYYFVVTFAGLLVQFGNLGLASSNTYLVASDRTRLAGLVANSVWVALAAGIGGALVAALLLGSDLVPGIPGALIWFGVALGPPSLLYLLGTNLLVGTGRIATFNLIELVANLAVLGLIVAAALSGLGVAGFLASAVIGWTLAAVAVLWILIGRTRGALRFDREVFAAGFRYAAKAYVITLLGYLVLRSNVFLLQSVGGPTQVGYYSIAAQVSDVLLILPASVAVVLFPDLVRSAGRRWSAMVRAAAVVTAIVVGACALTAVFAGPVLTLLYGYAFSPAEPVLLLMLPAVVFLSATTIVSQLLAAVGMPRSLVLIWAIALAIVVALNGLLAPALGASGAAVALSVTYLVLFLMIGGLAFRQRGVDPAR